MSKIITNTMIETVSGRIVDVAAPQPEDFALADIAWALSREPRYGGHTIPVLPYTVGQHSIEVAKIIERALLGRPDASNKYWASLTSFLKDKGVDMNVWMAWPKRDHAENFLMVAKLGLLHDGSEAYLRDLPSPVKNIPGLKEAYLAAEKKIMDAILDPVALCVMFDTKEDWAMAWNIVHWADIYTRTIEAYHFMPSRGSFWPKGVRLEVSLLDLQEFEAPRPSLEVYKEFQEAFHDLDRRLDSLDK